MRTFVLIELLISVILCAEKDPVDDPEAILLKQFNTSLFANDTDTLKSILDNSSSNVTFYTVNFAPGLPFAFQHFRFIEDTKQHLSKLCYSKLLCELCLYDNDRELNESHDLCHEIHKSLIVAFPYIVYMVQPDIIIYENTTCKYLAFSILIAGFRYYYDVFHASKGSHKGTRMTSHEVSFPQGKFYLKEFVASKGCSQKFCELLFDSWVEKDPVIRFVLAMFGHLDLDRKLRLLNISMQMRDPYTVFAALKSLHYEYQHVVTEGCPKEKRHFPPVLKSEPQWLAHILCNSAIDIDTTIDTECNNTPLILSPILLKMNCLLESLQLALSLNQTSMAQFILEHFDIPLNTVLQSQDFKPYLQKIRLISVRKDLSLESLASGRLFVHVACCCLSKNPEVAKRGQYILAHTETWDNLQTVINIRRLLEFSID
jgi:hypothetical protein